MNSNLQLVSNCYDKMVEQRRKDITIPNPFSGDDIDNPWYYYDRMYRGYAYDLFPPMASWVGRPHYPWPYIGVETNTTLLTDSRPSIAVAPREESDTELAETVQMAVDYWWENEIAQTKVSVAVKASRIFGIGWLYLYHSDKGECLSVVHPESILVDPDATVEKEPDQYIYEYRTSIGELMKRHPKVETETWGKCDPRWRMGTATEHVQRDRFEDTVNPAIVVSCYELWIRDGSYIEYDDTEVVKGKVTKLKKPKYKNGWRVITIAGGQEIEDKESPYTHGQAPFIPIHCYPVPGRFYSMGDIQQVFPMVIMRNRYQQYLYDQTLLAGGGKLIISQQSGIDQSKVSNVPIQIFTCKGDANQAMAWVTSPAPSRHIFDALAELDNAIQDGLGVHDISQGRYTPGNKTAAEIGTLTESDRTRIRLASRLLATSIQRVAYQLVSNWAQWGDFEWMLRLANKEDPTMDDFVAFSGKELTKSKMNPETEKLTKEAVQFDLRVGETSTLPGSRNELRMLVDVLAQQGLIGGVDQLKVVGWPNPEATYARSPRGVQDAQLAAQAAAPPEAPEEAAEAPEAIPQEMMPPGEMPPEMMGAEMPGMSPIPPGMSGDPNADLMMMIEQEAEASGIPPEVLFQILAEQGAV